MNIGGMKDYHFYKFSTATELGKAFWKLCRLCEKAEKAADRFAAKVGAVTFYPQDSMFAGGVACVAFKDNVCPKPEHWRSVGKDADGYEQWVPNVKQRTGAVELPNANFKPSDTANRIYQTRPVPGKDGKLRLPFVELYRDDIPHDKFHPKRKLPYDFREIIRTEKERLTLPTVSVMQLLNLLQADLTCGKGDDGKAVIVKPKTPTFFKYSRHFYLGCAYPCKAEGLKEISMGDYVEMEKEVRAMMRDLAAQVKSEK